MIQTIGRGGAVALTMILGLLISGPGSAEPSDPAARLAPEDLVFGLPWTFEIEREVQPPRPPKGAPQTALSDEIRYRFRSVEPIATTDRGPMFLTLELTVAEHPSAAAAGHALETLLDGADPDTGLTYAWDLLVVSGPSLYHLHAPCLLSEDHFEQIATRLERAVTGEGHRQTAVCRCGTGCRARAAED